MSAYQSLQQQLRAEPKTWLVTGVAGFIGSNIAETLLLLNQRVRGLDSLATGHRANLEHVRAAVSPEQWQRFQFIEGDIIDPSCCQESCDGVDFILHQAALGSVPRSIAEPLASHAANVTGFLNILSAANEKKVRRFVYASSSAVYGDHPQLPKVEEHIGQPLSPYAATKRMNEIYADVFARCYGLESIGLRYFNVFGPRQDPAGAYAAVVPRWTDSLLRGEPVLVNGDGETSRGFCYVANAVQANLLAAATNNAQAVNQVYNVAVGARTSLNQLFQLIQATLRELQPDLAQQTPRYQDFRPGDVRHSLADISKAQRLLGYAPTHTIEEGMKLAVRWYVGGGRKSQP